MGESATAIRKVCKMSGSYEDAFTSGMRVGLRLGGGFKWDVKDARCGRGITVRGLKHYLVMILISFVQLLVMLWDEILGGTGTREGKSSRKTDSRSGVAKGKMKVS
jgi:uncharacterized membrane protein